MKNDKLTLEYVIGKMNTEYAITYIDSNDTLDGHEEWLATCLKERSADTLNSEIDEAYQDAETARIDDIVEELKSRCEEDGYDTQEVEQFFDENDYEIREEIYDREIYDQNFDTLFRHTDDIPVIVELHSNYDCINSHYAESIYSYRESYFGDMVDALQLNPKKVCDCFALRGIPTYGDYPDCAERNGKELVSYEQFADEIENSITPVNLLTFMARVKISDLYNADFDIAEITIPKGNSCGLFSRIHGGGSLMDMELLEDVTLPLNARRYDYYSLRIDREDNGGYSLKNTYGIIASVFGKNATLTPRANHNDKQTN